MTRRVADRPNERGAILVLVALFTLFIMIAIIAFAIDFNHLYLVKNELQNAADAGALAGATALYEDPDGAGPKLPGEEVNEGANKDAYDVAILNRSDNIPVDVHFTDGTGGVENSQDVQRGHWSFSNDEFTPSDSLVATTLWGVSDSDLDLMDGTYEYPAGSGLYPVFVNAVKVTARREDTPALSFFARFFGFDDFVMQAEAVAYIGFSGSLGPLEADAPIVICHESILNTQDEYTCNVGRMINSSDDDVTSNTAGWTDMTVMDPETDTCSGTNDNSVNPLIYDKHDPSAPSFCNGTGVNPTAINGGDQLNVTNGQLSNTFNDMKDCWWTNTAGQSPVQMRLPVVLCDEHGIGNCPVVIGAVEVNLLMMTGEDSNKPDDIAPSVMADSGDPTFPGWDFATDCADFSAYVGQEQQAVLPNLPGQDYTTDYWKIYERWDSNGNSLSTKEYSIGMARWDCFVDHFQLENSDEKAAPLANKSLYFMPDCDANEPAGETSGSNFGVLAEFPVLVD